MRLDFWDSNLKYLLTISSIFDNHLFVDLVNISRTLIVAIAWVNETHYK